MTLNPQQRAALEHAGVAVIELFDGARFELPWRPPQRAPATALIVLGGLVAAFMIFWMSGPLRGAFRAGRPPNWGLLFFGLLGLPGLLAGLAMLTAGWAARTGRSRSSIEISRGRLRITEHFGPLRYSWKRALDQIRRIRFAEVARAAEQQGVSGPRGWSFAALSAENDAGRPFVIAPLYGADVLRPLADALAELAGRAAPDGAPPPVVVETDQTLGAPEPPIPRPAQSRVRIVELPEGFAIDAPPAGLIRGSHGLVVFAVLWLAMCALIFGVAFAKGGASAPTPVYFIALSFVAIGVAMLLFSVHLGRRRFIIAANARTIGIRRIGPFGTKEERYSRADLAAVRCGPSGIEVNDRPVPELQFHFVNRPKVGCLSQLSEEELRWLAQELRRRLGAPERAPGGSAS